jgi:hypothetical protein
MVVPAVAGDPVALALLREVLELLVKVLLVEQAVLMLAHTQQAAVAALVARALPQLLQQLRL